MFWGTTTLEEIGTLFFILFTNNKIQNKCKGPQIKRNWLRGLCWRRSFEVLLSFGFFIGFFIGKLSASILLHREDSSKFENACKTHPLTLGTSFTLGGCLFYCFVDKKWRICLEQRLRFCLLGANSSEGSYEVKKGKRINNHWKWINSNDFHSSFENTRSFFVNKMKERIMDIRINFYSNYILKWLKFLWWLFFFLFYFLKCNINFFLVIIDTTNK